MAKKVEKLSFKSILNQFMERSLQSLISVIAQEAEHVVEWIKNLSTLKKLIKKMLVAISFFISGLALLGFGIGIYLDEVFPELFAGSAYLLVGSIFLIVGALYMKIKQ